MPKYLCRQRTVPTTQSPAEMPSPAQMQAMYAKFDAWRKKFDTHLTDAGGRLGKGRLVTTDPAPDGPFVELKELLGGYMIVTADSLDEAVAIARECPGLVSPGSGVDVIEIRSA